METIVLKIADGHQCLCRVTTEEIHSEKNKLYFKDHWSFNKMLDTFKLMLDDSKTDFVCGFPYQLSIQEGLLFPEDVESDMLETDFNEIKWSINISVLLKPIEPVAYGGAVQLGANRETLSAQRIRQPCAKLIQFTKPLEDW